MEVSCSKAAHETVKASFRRVLTSPAPLILNLVMLFNVGGAKVLI